MSAHDAALEAYQAVYGPTWPSLDDVGQAQAAAAHARADLAADHISPADYERLVIERGETERAFFEGDRQQHAKEMGAGGWTTHHPSICWTQSSHCRPPAWSLAAQAESEAGQ